MKLDKLSKKELLDIAAKKKIAGRSKMTKPQLLAALEPFYSVPSAEKTVPGSTPSAYEIKEEKTPRGKKPKEDEYPLPPYYDADVISLMPVDPSKEYAYWEISDNTLNRVKSELRLSESRLILKIFSNFNGAAAEAASVSVERVGNWYFNIYAPDMALWSEIGLLDSNGAFHSILKSKIIKMPSDKVSDIIDDETWMTLGGDLDKIYRLSGVGLHDHNASREFQTELAKQISQHIASSGLLKDR